MEINPQKNFYQTGVKKRSVEGFLKIFKIIWYWVRENFSRSKVMG